MIPRILLGKLSVLSHKKKCVFAYLWKNCWPYDGEMLEAVVLYRFGASVTCLQHMCLASLGLRSLVPLGYLSVLGCISSLPLLIRFKTLRNFFVFTGHPGRGAFFFGQEEDLLHHACADMAREINTGLFIVEPFRWLPALCASCDVASCPQYAQWVHGGQRTGVAQVLRQVARGEQAPI